MPVIGSVRDQGGGIRIFFDLRPSEADPKEEARITRLIEHAFTPRSTEGGAEAPAHPG